MLALCAFGLLVVFFSAADVYGLGGRPWRGFWDATVVTTTRSYVTIAAQPRPDGATATAGIRNGDVVDLRDQTRGARYAWIYELMATQPTQLVVRRGNQRFVANVTGSTAFEGPWGIKIAALLSVQIAVLFFLGCAALIALRRPGTYEARIVALVLLLQTGSLLQPNLVVPNGALNLTFLLLNAGCTLGSLWLLVHLAARFGARSPRRRAIEWFAYALSALAFVRAGVAVLGIATLGVDPLPYVVPGIISSSWYPLMSCFEPVAAFLAVIAVAAVAVASTTGIERMRTAWLLLPLPIAFAAASIVSLSALLNASWFVFSGALVGKGLVSLLGALIVTYALLKRRVLDFEFILGRTLVVATVSFVVVIAFVLLEWLLGTVLSNASHATGLAANAVLALFLGLSLRYIHRRVDTFVDAVLFRKRQEDERALLDFAKEAAYVTDFNALLDTTLEKVRRHTDGRGAALLLDRVGSYAAVRWFGDDVWPVVSENDEAILSLKTWHKPLDPHHYKTALHGALAVPMLSRGRLVAILLLDERAGGEAYSPDDVEALSQLAQGVGSALDTLAESHGDSSVHLRDLIAELAAEVRALPERLTDEIARRLPMT